MVIAASLEAGKELEDGFLGEDCHQQKIMKGFEPEQSSCQLISHSVNIYFVPNTQPNPVCSKSVSNE